MLVLLLLSLGQVLGQEADDAYLKIFGVIQEADSLVEKGAKQPALVKYQEARKALQVFRTEYPGWNVPVITFRQNYVAERITALSAPPPAAAEPASKTQPSAQGAKPAESSSDVQVKLLEPGAEPRTELRLHPKAGDKQTVTVATKMKMEMGLGGAPAQPVQLPEINLVMEVTVKSVDPNGDIAYEVVIADAGVAGDAANTPQGAGMKASLGVIKGLSGIGTTSARGISKGSELQMPANAAPEARQGIEQIKDIVSRVGVALPEEPVGPGAKWEVRMPVKSQGITLSQTATYMLVSVEGDRIRAKNTLSQTAAKQKIESPGMPGMKLDLTKMEGQGVGDVTLDTSRVLPIEGKVIFKSTMAMSMGTGAQAQSMVMKVDSDVSVKSK